MTGGIFYWVLVEELLQYFSLRFQLYRQHKSVEQHTKTAAGRAVWYVKRGRRKV